MKKLLLATLLLGATPCMAADGRAANPLIVPGHSIGDISINQDADHLPLGKPDTGDAAMGKSVSTWFGKSKKTRLDIYAARNFGSDHDRARVKMIRVTSPFFHTAKGDSVGDSVSHIRRHYPKLVLAERQKESGKSVVTYDAVAQGIAFDIVKGRCIAVTVHEKGSSVSQHYLAFPADA